VAEKVALERLQQLVAHERLDLLVAPVLFEHTHVVLQRGVRKLERVFELVALEHVVVAVRLVGRPMLWIDGAADRPHCPRLALDPDHDPLLRTRVIDACEHALGEPAGG